MFPQNMLPEELYRAREVREMDRAVIEEHGVPGITLMRRAGEAALRRIMARYSGFRRMVVVCGAGNNGGDGYVVARGARRIGVPVTVLALAEPGAGDAATAARDYRDDGGAVEQGDPALLDGAGLVVDALFGTGLSRAPEGAAAEWIRRINRARCPVVSLDLPSGLHSDTGFAFAPCVKADATITFIALKLGLFTGRGRSHAGRILFEDLHVPAEARRASAPAARIIRRPRLARREREMHKGDAGRVLVVGGDAGMLGAVLMAGEAALRCGSGLVTVAGGPAHLDLPALHRPELMSADALQLSPREIAARADVVILGPGLGRSRWSEQVFERFIDSEQPLVVDADGLHRLAAAARRRDDWILTPHPGEAAALLGCGVAEVQADRPAAAREIAARFGGVCVLKGAGTLVAAGDGPLLLCDRGNPGMATAGMGDVLSGVIGSLLGQDMGQDMNLAAAAAAGTWVHAAAADEAARDTGERGLLAHDVIARLAQVVEALETD